MNTDAAGKSRIERVILDALAVVRQTTYRTLRDEMTAKNGIMTMSAKEESATVAVVEDMLHSGPLLEPKDFGKKGKQANSCLSPIVGTSVTELRDIIINKLKSIK